MQYSKPFFIVILMLLLTTFAQAQALGDSTTSYPVANKIAQSEWFEYEEGLLYDKTGKQYEIGRIRRSNSQHGPLALRIKKGDHVRMVTAPQSENLEINDIQTMFLQGRPFFLVIDRYKLFLVDMENEVIAPFMQPGIAIDYGEDAISGTTDGFQFFDNGNYLLGIAVSYGVFCFDISDVSQPKELQRHSAHFSDYGQPYFFLQQKEDGSWNGIIAQSDTLKKSHSITGFYTETKEARLLFQNAKLTAPTDSIVDPVFEPKPYLPLRALTPDGKEVPWVIDLEKGILQQDDQVTDHSNGKNSS